MITDSWVIRKLWGRANKAGHRITICSAVFWYFWAISSLKGPSSILMCRKLEERTNILERYFWIYYKELEFF